MFEFGGFVVGLERVFDVIRERGARAVGLQFPEGLMRYAIDISRLVGDLSGAEVFISGDSCFGACDIPNCKGVDLVVQFGHSSWNYDKESGIDVLR